MTTFDTTLEIAAPVGLVWSVLTDFPSYPEWNSAIPSLAGDLQVGSTLAIRLDLSGKTMDVTAVVQEVEPEARLGWRGHLGAQLLFTGRREFTLEKTGPDTTRFRHVESLTGLLVPAFLLLKGKAVAAHHDALDRSLKQRAEDLYVR